MEDNIIKIKEWKTPATNYPLIQVRNARITRRNYKKGYYHNYGVNGYKYFEVIKPIPITNLELKENKKWQTWMVDDPPHYWSMQNYANRSYRKVLIAGLGLGLVIHELSKNSNIDSITVIEIEEDVINLISPLLPKFEINFEIIKEDFFKFIEYTSEDFDRIIIDLWTSGSKEETMRILEEEVEPAIVKVIKRFPYSSGVIHGFGLQW